MNEDYLDEMETEEIKDVAEEASAQAGSEAPEPVGFDNNVQNNNGYFENAGPEPPKKKTMPPFRKGVFTGIIGTLAAVLAVCIFLYTVLNVRVGKNIMNARESEKLGALNQLLNEYYYEEVPKEDKINGIYKGLFESTGDRYTEYYTAEEYKNIMAELSGNYAGIGAVLQYNKETGMIEVITVYEGSAAEDAGLMPGDIIISVDGHTSDEVEDTDDFSYFVSDYIRGETGTVREIVYQRGEKEFTKKVKLREVIVPSVSYEMLDDEIGYISITQFSEGTQEAFEEALSELQKKGMKKVVYDLRSNGGGMVDSVVAILDDILPKGKVVYTLDKEGREEDYTSDAKKDLDIPAVVLTSGNTASAAEIFTGALRDYERATIVGTNTFGKGIVQVTLPLTDGSAIKVTNSRYFTPNGECIHGKGIAPDIELEYEFLGTEDDDYSLVFDNQVQKAVEVLKSSN